MTTIVGAYVSALAEVLADTIRIMERLRLVDRSQVDAALSNEGLRPPDASATLGTGSTAALRDRMARFSAAADHPARRAEVEGLIASIDHVRLEAETRAATVGALTGHGGMIDGAAIAARVPTVALLATLGWPPRAQATGSTTAGDLEASRIAAEDVIGLAAAVGRGTPVTPGTDAGVDRLLGAAEILGLPADAAVSVLYQNVDATAGLVVTTIHGLLTGAPRSPAVVRTVRVADEAVRLPGARTIHAGVEVELDLTVGGREFGFGPHACPGQATSEVIVAAIATTLTGAGWTRIEAVDLGPDGVPTRLDLGR